MGNNADLLRELIEKLTGQPATIETNILEAAASALDTGMGLGGSQFNELLLLMGYDRVEPEFFQYLAEGLVSDSQGASLKSFNDLEQGVERFQKLALLNFGNVKFGFKQLSSSVGLLLDFIDRSVPLDTQSYKRRHEPISPIAAIPGEDTYYLGYLIERELQKRLKANPSDEAAKQEEAKRRRIVDVGKRNQKAYLASDHLDVYVATSMRERHEFLVVHQVVQKIFENNNLKNLHLRWFDPTQAYCKERIDKGLAEALMLKRARCTLYFVQESDTYGKDSELATTLAQGKPVVAFVPEGDQRFLDSLLTDLQTLYPNKTVIDLIMEQLQVFQVKSAWQDATIREWLSDPSKIDLGQARKTLQQAVATHYDKRAETLKDLHPLGIQVCLDSGVANGVLVVRSVSDCAKLIRDILLNQLKFRLEFETIDGANYLKLTESISGCVFRVMSGDAMLTNSFWNFYLS